MKRPKDAITVERARLVVEDAPGFDRELLVAHVRKALQAAYDEGVRAGHVEAQETVLRRMLAFCEGHEARARGAANEARNDLNAVLDALGKSRVFPP